MKKALALLFAAALFSVTAPAAIIIDNFNNGDDVVTATTNGIAVSSHTGSLAGVLDGSRMITAFCDAGILNCSNTRSVTVGVDQGEGAASIGASVAGEGSFLYANGDPALGLNGGLGYAFSGVFLLDVKFFNPGNGAQSGTQARVTLNDGTLTKFVEQDILGVGTLSFDTDDFAAQGLDMGSIISIELKIINANEAPDVSVDNFRVVPEPGTYAMLGAGLTGLALLRRRAVK